MFGNSIIFTFTYKSNILIMKKMFFTIAVLIVIPAIIIISCKKDKDNDETPTPVITNTYSISVSGTVYEDNVNLTALPGVAVKIGSSYDTTDINGMFYIANVSVPKDRFVIEFSKTGYFTLSRSAIPTSGAKIDMEAGLISETDPTYAGSTTFSATTTDSLELSSGCTVVFPANSLVTANNTLHTGTVKVKAAFLDPTMANYGLFIFGGDLYCKDSTGSDYMLNPYSGLNVVITDNSNSPLQLDAANNKKATIRMAIPTSLLSSSPNTIVLCEYNKSDGMSYAAGSASKSGGKYMGQVGHFSYWSCQDIVWGKATINGTVTSQTGHPVQGVRIKIGRQLTLCDISAVTDIDGHYSVVVPANFTGRVEMVPTFFTSQSPNPDIINTPIGSGQTYTADFTVSSIRKVTGRLVNCSGAPVSGRVVLNFNTLSGNPIHVSCFTSSTGVFYLPMQMFTTFGSINAFGNNTDTTMFFYPLSSDTLVDVGDIALCVPATPGINQLTLTGNPFTSPTTVNSFTSLRNGYKFTDSTGTSTKILVYGSSGDVSIDIKGTALNVIYPVTGSATISVYIFNPSFSDSFVSGTVRITKFGAVGELIEGTYSGTTVSGVQVSNGKFSVVRTPDQP